MQIKLFSTLPSLNDYEVKFSRWHFMTFQFFNISALLKCSVLRNFTSSVIETRGRGKFATKTAFLLPSPSWLLNPLLSHGVFSLWNFRFRMRVSYQGNVFLNLMQLVSAYIEWTFWVLFLHLSHWFKINSKMKTRSRICPKLCCLNLSDQPKRNFYLLKMTYFSLLNCQESEAHVILQMTTLKKFQLSLRHAHGSHVARAAYSPKQYVFQNWRFFLRDFIQDFTFHVIPE